MVVVPAFQSVLLHRLPGGCGCGGGWEIIGVTGPDRQRQLIALVAPVAGEWFARRLADLTAQQLAEKYSAEIE